ncbi:MAG: phosphatase PAP2 family protein [Clostridia bacterium]|nr:phosphatase PAP2 family protein [Clostridia bacterium]
MDFLWFLTNIRCEFLDKLFLIITTLGEKEAFLAVAMIVLWCFSKRDGYYIMSVGFIGTIANQFLKFIFRIERPWVLDKSFKPVEEAIPEATGYSFPSGHTQNSVGTFGALAYLHKKLYLRISFIALCVLIPFSRMYLGVHTPKDVLVSVVIALMLVFLLRPVVYWATDRLRNMMIFLGIMTSLCVIFILFMYLAPLDFVAEYHESGLENGFTLLGALFGMLVAYPIESKFIGFEVEGRWYTQIFKCIAGLPLCLVLMELLKLPLDNLIPVPFLGRVIRYSVVVMFAVVVYPLTFKLWRKLENVIEPKKKGC